MWRVKTEADHDAFAKLVRRWEQPIRRLCIRMTGDVHRGEELKQDAFLRLFEKRADYQPKAKFSTFLWRIALNLCYDELRRQTRRAQFINENRDGDFEHASKQVAVEMSGPDLRAATSEEGELVRRAVMQLPESYRSVLVLRHYEGLKLAESAEVLQIPEGTVNSRMAEALSRLSRVLGPRLRPVSFSQRTQIPLPKEPVVL